jgi:F-type H+-transporting ATPase subunit beta
LNINLFILNIIYMSQTTGKPSGAKAMEGKVKQVIGAVVDVEFTGVLPDIYTALESKLANGKLVMEVQQHIGFNVVRTVAMGSTDGLRRGDRRGSKN